MKQETLIIVAAVIPNQINNVYLQLQDETISWVKERSQATTFSSRVLAMGWAVQAQSLFQGYKFSLINIVRMTNS